MSWSVFFFLGGGVRRGIQEHIDVTNVKAYKKDSRNITSLGACALCIRYRFWSFTCTLYDKEHEVSSVLHNSSQLGRSNKVGMHLIQKWANAFTKL